MVPAAGCRWCCGFCTTQHCDPFTSTPATACSSLLGCVWGVCMQRDSDFQGCGLASVQIHMVSGTGLSWSVVLDQWLPGLGVQPLVRGAPDRR